MTCELLTIIFAYVLDLIIGDPQWRWHPVRLIGRSIELLEKRLNSERHNKFFSGIALVIIVAGLTVSIVWIGLDFAKRFNPVLYYVCYSLLIYFSFSIKALAVEAKKVYNALKNKNIQEARNNLAMIVGRDTDQLDEPQIVRAAVETVAESAMDGIIAPLFCAFIAGPLLVWGYKAINTLDSMVGYKNERFRDFGRASAKLDGLLNFIPSKITSFLIALASLFYRKNWCNSARYVLKFLFKGPENNSAATEAAMAGALNIQLGGTNFYNSVPVYKPFLGDKVNELEKSHIIESIHIVTLGSFLFLLIGIVCWSIITWRR